jgi:hypothetical protein
MSPAVRGASPVPNLLGRSESANDSITWVECTEARNRNKVEIRHVRDKIAIRESYYRRCSRMHFARPGFQPRILHMTRFSRRIEYVIRIS